MSEAYGKAPEKLKSEVLEAEVAALKEELAALKAAAGKGSPAPPPPPGFPGDLWAKPLSASATLAPVDRSPAAAERHRIYAHLCGAVVAAQFNHRKYGYEGEYPLCVETATAETTVASYQGHNIAALAVDATGRVTDYAFNHNALFASTVEHAEARLLARLFSVKGSLAHHGNPVSAEPGPVGTYEKKKYSKVLRDTTVYTSLESRAPASTDGPPTASMGETRRG